MQTLLSNLIKIAASSIVSCFIYLQQKANTSKPIHFIDAFGEKPSKELDMRSVVQDKLAVWVYHDLAVTKVE